MSKPLLPIFGVDHETIKPLSLVVDKTGFNCEWADFELTIISLSPMISEAMKRIANSTSVSSLFK